MCREVSRLFLCVFGLVGGRRGGGDYLGGLLFFWLGEGGGSTPQWHSVTSSLLFRLEWLPWPWSVYDTRRTTSWRRRSSFTSCMHPSCNEVRQNDGLPVEQRPTPLLAILAGRSTTWRHIDYRKAWTNLPFCIDRNQQSTGLRHRPVLV